MMQPLLAHGICVRPFQKTDVAEFGVAARESVSTVGVWMPWCHDRYSASEAESWFDLCERKLRADEAYDAGIFSADGTELLGGVAINQINREHNFGNIGYWVRQTRQRQGVASRAVRMIAEYGFGQLKLTRLEIVIAEDNLASRELAKKIGATLECIARNRLIAHGKPRAAAVYSLIPGMPIST